MTKREKWIQKLPIPYEPVCLSEYEKGLLLGLLIGEAHFGGDGRQPQINVRMHVRHTPLLQWVCGRLPGSRLYGPYQHDKTLKRGLQMMLTVRGRGLRESLVPLLRYLKWRSGGK